MSAPRSYLFPAEGASIYRLMDRSNTANGRCRAGQMMTVTPTDNRMMKLGSDAHIPWHPPYDANGFSKNDLGYFYSVFDDVISDYSCFFVSIRIKSSASISPNEPFSAAVSE
jgi:hypothetical protein